MKTDECGNGLCDKCGDPFCNKDGESVIIASEDLCGECVRDMIAALQAENEKYHLLKDAVNSDSGDCTRECDSYGHADDCTWFEAADVITTLKKNLAAKDATIERLRGLLPMSLRLHGTTHDLDDFIAKGASTDEPTS